MQFGAHAELFARKSKFSISGQAGYDVLIQFDPFHFVASLYASLQLKAGSTNLFKVSFAGELSGPRPLNVKGKAKFEIWWMDFTVSFNVTLVSGQKPPLPAPVDVGALLRTALADAASWNAVMPGTSERLVSLREGPAGAVRIHPLSTLTVKQSVVPLNVPISRFGNTRPVGGPQEFRIQQVVVGGTSFTPDVVRDHFAPAQFRDLSDDEKLSSPSFELLPAGVSVGNNAADCGTPVPAAADFEDIVIPSPPEAAAHNHDHRVQPCEPVRGVECGWHERRLAPWRDPVSRSGSSIHDAGEDVCSEIEDRSVGSPGSNDIRNAPRG